VALAVGWGVVAELAVATPTVGVALGMATIEGVADPAAALDGVVPAALVGVVDAAGNVAVGAADVAGVVRSADASD
jgi:hypothetical protein